MTDPRIAEIAAKLTEAQKRLLLALDPVEYRDWKALSRSVNTRNALARHGLSWFDDASTVRLYFMRKLSPLGQQVAAYLKEQSSHD
jgi:hypothetical protein